MVVAVNEKVKVGMSDAPKWVQWKLCIYKIQEVGFHYTLREGRILYHLFSVNTETLYMKLSFNTETLGWRLLEVENGI
ncbi:MAG: seg [Microgenomates group bacterium GW2011_GWC1_43_13]|uniref:Uncharacterized protein n=3 Tax=Candidatus Woeseibacteriota TaxID=1752722 RepID=A0A837I995_9BACT|nr:MAG: seg [Microgenomates group bacterium GW2011_GWC1_43_13]KKT32636.1 MAG: hypothetical protein UW20_C0011G0006 [Candidatus Woesebacteria bacterium GW2011_GWB1_44_11]KKT54209.1 MAG: hypothetical protein UW47_C0008G0008 [Candidatus Woesebacteria bacterium GW2011_GWA1_44_23]OGM76257.1 MAG: hypothetical protein A2208_02255 [Candidatus Woesebacteria bacterium RIFOXYA1_FULL_43_16]OGM84933.1 MAG: hypothetical protein A2421_00235 [Candidatus Woesebacteria bacterium RIFOXYC1_FULL_43_18]OGM87823.1 M